MKQQKAPETTRQPQQSQPSVKSPSALFLTLALDMTWRLALVVLVPVIGGFKLDEKLGSTPSFTILGFVVAMTGMGYVMWRTVQVANAATTPKKEEHKCFSHNYDNS